MEPFLGQITMFGFDWAPRGWARCDGQLLPINSNQSLFSLLGTIYGGDGRTTFALPGLRGRVGVHSGQGAGLTNRTIGQKTGGQTTILNTNNMPAHTHNAVVGGDVKLPISDSDANTDSIADGYLTNQSNDFYHDTPSAGEFAGALANSITVSVTNAGAGQDFNNMQPYLVINYCIALTGIYPSRN
jgi:microcystin-dependent protein